MTAADGKRIHQDFPPPAVWSPFEMRFAQGAIARQPRRKVYLEMGSFRGGSFWAFSNTLEPGATMISVDWPNRNSEVSLARTGALLTRRGFEVHLIRGKTQDSVEQVRAVLAGRQVDVMVIDADHGPGMALRDWKLYSPFLNGLAIFHDCGIPTGRHALNDHQKSFMASTRAGFMEAAKGRLSATAQDDFGTGLIWK